VRGRRLGTEEGREWIRGEVGKKGIEKEMRGEGKERKGKIEKEKEK